MAIFFGACIVRAPLKFLLTSKDSVFLLRQNFLKIEANITA